MTIPKTSKARPDSGWSWVVAVSCSFIFFVMFGINRLAGVFLVATRKEFSISRKVAALPYILAVIIRNASAPIAGILCKKFGVRNVSAAGSLLAACGVALCSLATNVIWITVCYGIIFGFGFGIGSLILPLSITQYFITHRATASGISFSGACFGSFFLPSLIDFLLREYGLNGTFLLASTLLLHCVPIAMLLRKPPYDIESFTSSKYQKSESINVPSKSVGNLEAMEKRVSVDSTSIRKAVCADSFSSDNTKESGYVNAGFNALNEEITDHDQNSIKCFKSHSISGETNGIISETNAMKVLSYRNSITSECLEATVVLSKNKDNSLRQYTRLFTHPIFDFICLSIGIYTYTFTIMLTCVVDFVTDIGVEEERLKYILMSFSVGDLIGRLSLGSITDRGYMTKAGFTSTSFFLQGIMFVFVALAKGFWTLTVASFLYGVFQAGVILIYPLLVAHYVESDLLVLAVPCSHILCPPLSVLIPIVIGYFREGQGSYVGLFYHVAILSFIVSAMWFLFPILQKRCKKNTTSM